MNLRPGTHEVQVYLLVMIETSDRITIYSAQLSDVITGANMRDASLMRDLCDRESGEASPELSVSSIIDTGKFQSEVHRYLDFAVLYGGL